MTDATYMDLPPPPRRLPLSVRACVLFGGGLNLAGWIVLLVGTVFVWILGVNSDLPALWQFDGELETVQGKVTKSEKTAFTEGGSRTRRGTRVYANHYTFTTDDGRTVAGVSYARGRALKPGQQATIEFVKGEPTVSRIRGMRTRMLSPWAGVVYVLPLVGVLFVFAGMRRGWKACRLLADGQVGLGVLTSKTLTGARVNSRPVYKLTFEFKASDGRTYEVTSRTHKPEALEDDAQERLLYDPFSPSYAVLFDSLPGAPQLDSRGEFKEASPGKLAAVLGLPILTIVGHGGYALLLWA